MKKRSTKRNTEKFRYHRRVVMFDDGQGRSFVLPETMESGLERQHWASGEPCTNRSWRAVPPVNVGNSGHQGGQQTAASVCSAKPKNENVPMESLLYSGGWSQHTQGDPIVEFPHGHSKSESGFYNGILRCNYNQEIQDSGQFKIGNRPHDYAYSNVCRDVQLETTYPACHSLTGLSSANPLHERFVTSREKSCNCPSFEQQPYCSDNHSQPYCHPNGPNSIFDPIPGWFESQTRVHESQSTERKSLIPVKAEVVDQNNDTHVFNQVAQFGNRNAPSAAPTKVGKDCNKSKPILKFKTELYEGFSAINSEVQLVSSPRPPVLFHGHLVAKRSLFGLENASGAGIPETFVFCGPVTPKTPSSDEVNSFPGPVIKSSCNSATCSLKSSKLYEPIDSPENFLGTNSNYVYGDGLYVSPGTRPIATKTRFVPSILKHVAVKGRKSAIMKCNINAKRSVVRKIDEKEVTQSSNLKQDKESKVTQQDRLASASLEPNLGNTHTIRQEEARRPSTITIFSESNKAAVIKRTPLENVNEECQKSETQDSQSSSPSQKAKKYMYLKSYPRRLSKTPQHKQPEEKSERTMSGVIETGQTGILTVEKSHEAPIPNYIKQRMKCGGKLEQVVSRLKARGQGSSKANAIDLTTDSMQ